MLWKLMKNAWCAWLDWQISADYEGYIYKWTLVGGVDVACDKYSFHQYFDVCHIKLGIQRHFIVSYVLLLVVF